MVGRHKGSTPGEGAEAAQGKTDQGERLYRYFFFKETLIHPTHQNKWVIIDPSDLRIKHVSIKTDAFRWDLWIRGLHSPIGATFKKSKFGQL
jgi:hypothetical protein